MRYSISRFFIKILIVCIGVASTACGIAIFYVINIGSDPISVFVDGQHRIFGLSYGIVNLIDSIIYLIFVLIFNRKLVRTATLISGAALGPLINLFTGMFSKLILPKGTFTLQFIASKGLVFIPPEGNYFIRFLMLIPAVVLLGCGLGLYLSANMGAAPVDALVIFISDNFNKPLKKVKIAFDFIVAVLGFLLGGVTGVGTIIGIIMTGPMIGTTIKKMEKLKRKIVEYDERNNESEAMA